MSGLQSKMYWALFAQARRAQPGLDRKALHAELALPESHGDFDNRALDTWKDRCTAIAKPADFKAQLEGVRMPATRHRFTIRRIAAALGVDDRYIEGCVAKLFRSRPFLTLEILEEDDAMRVLIALKKHARRKWRTKAALLGDVQKFCCNNHVEDAVAVARAVLNRIRLPSIEVLSHDELLTLLGALAQAQGERSAAPA